MRPSDSQDDQDLKKMNLKGKLLLVLSHPPSQVLLFAIKIWVSYQSRLTVAYSDYLSGL